jgi:predicted transcriptional regulator
MSQAITIQASDELAHQIHTLHRSAEDKQAFATDGIQELIDARLNVAALVETAKAAKGQHFRQWWDDQQLPTAWAARYLTIAKTFKRSTLGDKNQMKLIGIIPQDEQEQRPQQQREENSLEWIKLAGRLSTTLTEERISKMDNFQRRLAMDKLEPFIAIYKKLKGND